MKTAAIVVAILLVSLTSVQCAVAQHEGGNAALSGPDVRVIMKATGDLVGGAKVYIDNLPAVTTDSKGNLTLKEAPASGNHTVTVVKNGLQNATITTDFATKPALVSMTPAKGKNLTIHITDKSSKAGIANAEVFNNKYLMGSTDADGNLNIGDFPQGLYLIKLSKDGYKTSTTLLIVFSNRTQSYTLTPA
ncbi:MAG: hypothetical protein WBZ29_09495 [Methanocella sp.]